MFGHTFVIPHGAYQIVMRKPGENDAQILSSYMDDYIASQFVIVNSAMTLQDEVEWLEKTRKDRDSFVWMVDLVKDGEQPILAGVTSLHCHGTNHWSSGMFLSNRELWGLGIASMTHKLRTWFAFAELGAYFITSSFVNDNPASGRALASVGYIQVGRCPRCRLVAGKWRDMIDLVCYNPATLSILWPEGDIPNHIVEATVRTEEAMRFTEGLIKPR